MKYIMFLFLLILAACMIIKDKPIATVICDTDNMEAVWMPE